MRRESRRNDWRNPPRGAASSPGRTAPLGNASSPTSVIAKRRRSNSSSPRTTRPSGPTVSVIGEQLLESRLLRQLATQPALSPFDVHAQRALLHGEVEVPLQLVVVQRVSDTAHQDLLVVAAEPLQRLAQRQCLHRGTRRLVVEELVAV